MTPLSQKHARMTELEWLICNETDRQIRSQHIAEFNDLYEELHGRGSFHGSREAPVRALCSDR